MKTNETVTEKKLVWEKRPTDAIDLAKFTSRSPSIDQKKNSSIDILGKNATSWQRYHLKSLKWAAIRKLSFR